ncbi:BREX-3 system P-loop-containing protein BrxF [Shewanella sp. GXUN23E]|uniref:BREX-3 system P-loop-containing protein BrxF n=1 Tax=Shewanella sp. GXUN23E TaxID=3422498 RepID=UPI003D7DDC1E
MACFEVGQDVDLGQLLEEQAKQLALQSQQLLILVGICEHELKLLDKIQQLSVSSLLCEKLLPLSNAGRVEDIECVLEQTITCHTDSLLLLDRIHVLFEPSLELDVLRCLKALSRQRLLIVNWPGEYDGKVLSFSRHGKPDHFDCLEADLNSVPVLWRTGHGES